jgi:hypothetical protein
MRLNFCKRSEKKKAVRVRATLSCDLASLFLSMSSLNAKALLSVLLLGVVMAAILFITAGTVDYWQAWVFLVILIILSLLITIYLIRNDPELLKRRMRGGQRLKARQPTRDHDLHVPRFHWAVGRAGT